MEGERDGGYTKMRIYTEDNSGNPFPYRALRTDSWMSDNADETPVDEKVRAGTHGKQTKPPVREEARGSRPQREAALKMEQSAKRFSRIMTLDIAAKEYTWLWDLHHSVSAAVIAAREGITLHRIRFGVARALGQAKSFSLDRTLRAPRLVPLFPIGPYTPHSACGHRGPIQSGSLLCCMVCHRSGVDDHPALRHSVATDPARARSAVPFVQRTSHETRRDRRQRLFGSHCVREHGNAAREV
jgi:hypothetical protein